MTETILTAGWLLAASIFDVRRRKVPVWLLALGGAAVVPGALWGCVKRPEDWIGVAAGCVPGLVLFCLAGITRMTGPADGAAMLLMGLLLKNGCLTVFAVSLLMISAYSVLLLMLKRAGKDTQLPYLPFLAAAWAAHKMFGGIGF